MPYESPIPSVYSLGRDEGSLSLNELTVLCTSLSKKEKISDDTVVVLEEEEPTELVEDQGSGEKREKEVSTVGAEHRTAIPEVSTATVNLVYIRRSVEKRKDKGKAILTELEPYQTTTKLKLRQERAGLEAAIRLQEQLNEEDS
ncbi:hypothetical protein Tco_1579085 [Tanacetum coccineum]